MNNGDKKLLLSHEFIFINNYYVGRSKKKEAEEYKKKLFVLTR